MSDSKWYRSRIAAHVRDLPRSGIRDFFELVNTMDDVVSFGIGEPDFVTPWGIREAAIYALDQGRTSYTSNLGLRELRVAACDYVLRTEGLVYDPENDCLITTGVSEGLDLAFRALLDPGDEVIYHVPGYVSYAPSIAMAHAVPVPVSTSEADGFALSPEALLAQVTPKTKVVLLNFPNNPTGAGLSSAAKAELTRIVVERDLLVIADEIYAELSYDGCARSIAACPGMQARTILLKGLSKSHAMTGFRIAYACGPHALIEAMMKIHQYSMLCAPTLAQTAAVEALRHGARAVADMRSEYEQRRNVIVKRLRAMGLPCVMPQGAFYVFPRITGTGLSSQSFAEMLLKEEGVAVVPGTAFGPSGEGYVRCSYATAMADIELGMNRMSRFVRKRLSMAAAASGG